MRLAKQIEKIINKAMPCTCHEDYKKRGLEAPDCANHLYKLDLADRIAGAMRISWNEELTEEIIIAGEQPKAELPKPFYSSDHFDVFDVACKQADIIRYLKEREK